MDFDKLKVELKKLLKNKKINNLIIVLLVILFILLAFNILFPKEKENTYDEEIKQSVEVNKNKEYEEKEKKELIDILKSIQGVGEVEVKINFESDEVKVPAYEKNTQVSKTEETDVNGGKRINNQTNDSTSVVMATDKPYILQTYKPKVIGIVVVAEGASDSKIKHEIEAAVSSLYALPANKGNVYPMK